MKLITSQWDLTAYISLTKYNEEFEYINTVIDQTKVLCAEHMHDPVTNNFNCNNLLLTATTIVDNLYNKKTQVLDSIGHIITRRSALTKLVTKAAKLIYGICNLECIQKFNFNIAVAQNTSQSKLIKEQIKVVQLQHNLVSHNNVTMLPFTLTVNELTNITKEQQIKNYLTKHFIHVSLLITKHMVETNTLLEIIQQAKMGIIHPSLITPKELLEHIKDIKVSLPGGTDLPTDFDIQNIYELVRLSDIAIYYSNDNLVFIISLPLIYQNNFILYNLIPVPVCTGTDCVYVKPSNKYLAISKTKEHYAIYDEFYYTHCKHGRDFLLCPEGNPLHPRSSRPACEVQLLQDPVKVPPSCEIRHVQIGTSIFHKKRFKNEWIYVTNYDVIFVTCDEDKESTSHTLKGVGIIRLNETCKGYAARDVLIPGKVDYKADYNDFFPKSIIERVKDMPYTDNNNLMEDYHVKTNNMDDLHSVSNSKKQLDNQNKFISKLNKIEDVQNVFNYTTYVIMSIIFMTIIIIVIDNVITRKKSNSINTTESQPEAEELNPNQDVPLESIDIVEFPLTPRNSPAGSHPQLRTYLE